jgi:type III restriction enzyme
MKIKFESGLEYQHDAINAIVDIFNGQEICTSNFTVYSPAYIAKQGALELNQIGFANKLVLTSDKILENVQHIQLRNGLKPSTDKEVDKHLLDFSIEMETGTGKTYVYLRSIMEMNRQYGFTKFIIVVPSIPIKEGVYKSLQITEEHLRQHYNNIDYKYFIYNSSSLNEIRDFAVNDKLQIMVINIQAFAKDLDDSKKDSETTGKKGTRILLEYNDKLGYKPISLIQNTRPVVIIDEPQSTMNTPLAKKSVHNLKPLVLLRYSATHKEKVNLMYKLDAVDAYNQQLVKEIEVASIKVDGAPGGRAFIHLLSVSNKNGISAKLELDIKASDGGITRKRIDVKKNTDLLQLTKLAQYSDFMVRDIYTAEDNQYIEFINDTEIKVGQSINSVDDSLIKRLQIRKTIEEHLNKELQLNPKNIKVLSLFFIDAVKHYRIYDADGNATNGDYANMFEEEYKKLIKKSKYQGLFKEIVDLTTEVPLVHNGYFSIDKQPKASNKKEKFEYYKDTSGSVSADEDTYNLIMKDKEKLLSFDSKLRFIFSHSALKEGWDNPNVFQICTLKEAGASEIRRRQEIGRGLRLAVNQDGERVRGFDVNKLTVMASESYEDFVDGLQKEIEKDTGIVFGLIQEHSFNNVVVEMRGNEPVFLGQDKSTELFTFLTLKGYINTKGKVQDTLREDIKNGNVDLGQDFEPHVAKQILETLKLTAGKLEIKKNEDKKIVTVKEHVLDNAEFKSLWEKVKFKTTYSVNFDPVKLIDACIRNINSRLVVSSGKLIYSKVDLQLTKGGLITSEATTQFSIIDQEVEVLPDIVSYLQNETQLTRKSIVNILSHCNNLNLFKINPQKYIEGCIDIINEQRRLHIVDGIVYSKIGDNEFYSQELFKNETLTGYLKKNMLASTKSPYEYVVYDSGIESSLAKEFEKNDNIKVYAKLPGWFKIDTPLGTYNPDWAVLFETDGEEQLFFVVESKGTMGFDFLRPSEQGKIECGKAHFRELSKQSGSNISLEFVSNMDDFVNIALSVK